MKRDDQITGEAIHAYISAHAGTRFTTHQLADTFGVSHASMRESLNNLARQAKIRKSSDGLKAKFYVLSATEAESEAKANGYAMREWKPDPVFLRRAKEAQEHKRQFPSKHV